MSNQLEALMNIDLQRSGYAAGKKDEEEDIDKGPYGTFCSLEVEKHV